VGAVTKLSPDYMKSKKPSGYDLSRAWFDFIYEESEDVKPHHTSLYFFIIERANKSGWKELIDMPTDYSMEGSRIGNFTTYKNCLLDLEKWGFIQWEIKSRNQYSCNKIKICFDRNVEATPEPPTEANETLRQNCQSIDQSNTQSIDQSIDCIYKLLKPIKPIKPLLINNGGMGFPKKNIEEKTIPLETEKKEEIPEAEILEDFPFDDFWELYDKKIDKPDCLKEWQKLKDRQKEEIMLHHLPRYVSVTEKRFRKDPIRYLKKNAWENEIIEPVLTSSNNKKNGAKQFSKSKLEDAIRESFSVS
jgi:hypothetical protein